MARKRNATSSIMKIIKEEYKKNRDLHTPYPKSLKRCTAILVVNILVSGVLELVAISYRSIYLGCWFVISLVCLGLVLFVYKKYEKKYSAILQKKYEENRDICKMILEDVAKKYNVTAECLALYLQYKKVNPMWIRTIILLISVTFTGVAVYLLPGYDQTEQGVIVFIMLLIANVWVSTGASIVCNEINTTIKLDFDFYVVEPFKNEIEKIESNDDAFERIGGLE